MRPLTEGERALVALLLSGDAPGNGELRAQIPATLVVEPWSPGSASLHLAVDTGTPRSEANGPVGSGWVYDRSDTVLGTLLLWATDGYLSGLEYGWVTDEAPAHLPPVEAVRLDG